MKPIKDPLVQTVDSRPRRREYRPKGEEITAGWRQIHAEHLYNLLLFCQHCYDDKTNNARWTGHVARLGKTRNACSIAMLHLMKISHFGDRFVYDMIILK
jgi:hypothetical protein